ncbi:MAG: low molecular weight phosphatase family protein [Actinomycetes bacterium]
MRGIDRFRILYVCTGNVCRSPAAERLTLAWLAEHLGDDARAFEVASAGTHGLIGHAMDDDAARALEKHGGSPEGFTARVMEPYLVESSDLVVGLARAHRAAAARMAPAAMRRAFTLRELDRLAQATEAMPPGGSVTERARKFVDQAASLRGTLPRVSAEDDDVADPIGRPPEVHIEVTDQIAETVQRVMTCLTS